MLHIAIGRCTPDQHILSHTLRSPAASSRLCDRRSCNTFHTGNSHERVTASSSSTLLLTVAELGMTFPQAQRRVSSAMGGAPGAPGASAASPPKRKADGHVLEPDEEREHEAGDAVRSSPDLC